MNNIRVKKESLSNWREESIINEEIEGGISVQNVADGLNFTEIETVDIIKPEPIKGSSNIEEGAGRIIKQIVKSPGVKKFVSNLSKSSKIKSISPKLVTTPGSTLGSGGKFAANHFDNVSQSAGSSYIPKHVRYLDDLMDKSKRGLTGTAGAKGFATPGSKSVKVYKQPTYAKPDKYPGDKTGAYARELARQDNTARIGKNSSINKDGISNKGYYNPDGTNTVGGKVKLKKINDSYNWKLEIIAEMLISEGYNDDEINTILSEELPKIPLGPILTGAVRGAWNLSTKGVRGAYNLGKGTRSVVNRGVRDAKLTKDVIDLGKKLRKPDGISVTNNPRNIKVPEKGGNMVKSFKGFLQNIKNRTGAKLDRINAKKAEIASTAKDVDVLGGAATNPATKIKPMKNITPSSIGDKITNATDKVKVVGAGAAGAAIGSASSKLSPSKVATATTPVEKKVEAPITKVEAPITNDGKKEVDPSKNEKIESQPTKRELRNKRNEYLSSKEGRRERRDARVKNKISGNRPTGKTKWVGKNTTWKDRYGNVIAPKLVDKKEKEVTNEGIVDTFKNLLKLGKNPKHKVSDETPMGKAVTGLQKRSEANKKAMELLNHYSWRDELNLQEMGAYQGGGTIINPSGSRNKFGLPDSLKPGSGPTKEVPLTPSQNRLLVKKKTKTTKVG